MKIESDIRFSVLLTTLHVSGVIIKTVKISLPNIEKLYERFVG